MEFYCGIAEDVSSIEHFGKKGKSGRYPWGSGERPYQRLEKRRGLFRRKKKEPTSEAIETRPGVKMYSTRQQVQEAVSKTNPKDVSVSRDIRTKGNSIKDTRKKMMYMYQHKEEYTVSEIKDMVVRAQAEYALKQEIERSKPVSKSKLNKIMDTANNVSESASKTIRVVENGLNNYNRAVRIYNGLIDEQIKSGKAKPMKSIKI